MNRNFVRTLLVEESFAYGFTIAFWGSGLLLINEYGLLHTLGIFEYASGAITGFGVLAVATFGGPVDTVDVDESPSYFILAGIHYLSGLVPIAITHGLLALTLGKAVTLFLTGMAVSICYNLFVTFEEVLSEMAWQAEQTVLDEWKRENHSVESASSRLTFMKLFAALSVAIRYAKARTTHPITAAHTAITVPPVCADVSANRSMYNPATDKPAEPSPNTTRSSSSGRISSTEFIVDFESGVSDLHFFQTKIYLSLRGRFTDMHGRYGDLDYPRLTKLSFLLGIGLFVVGELGEFGIRKAGMSAPAWEHSLLMTAA